jgi:hypothetical protein
MCADIFGNAPIALAIGDRLCYHCHLIHITGSSYRIKGLPAAKSLKGGHRHRFWLILLPRLVNLYCPNR